MSFVICPSSFSRAPRSAQTTALTINSSTGLVNVPAGVTPNFAALQLGSVSLGSAATHAAGDFVSSTITINGHATTGNITLTASDVSAVPTTRQVNGHALSSDVTVTKSDLSLGSVENTALSTWPGTSNITTLGTIATGTWHGTVIADSYIASAATWNAKQSALTFSTGLTNTSNTITVNAISLSGGGSGGVTGTLPLANGGTGATTLAAAQGALGWSKNIVVLSAKVTCDSNIDSGGGTDHTSAVNTILATASASTPLWLIWDGTILTSAPLVVYSHTRIDAMPHCGLFLALHSDCVALSNQLSGSTIANTDIEIRNLEINCNGNNQHTWEANATLTSTTGASGVTHTTTTIDYTPNAVVVPGMHVTGTEIPTESYVASVTSGHAVLTNAATGSHSSITFSFDFSGANNSPYDRVVGRVFGVWFSGFQRLKLSGVTVRNACTLSIVLSNGSDFVIERCKSLWDDNPGIQTIGGGATTNTSTTISYSADPGYGTGAAIVQTGYTVVGTGIPVSATVSSVTDSTHAVLSAAATASNSGLTFTTTKLTNLNRDGIHMWGNLDTGHIVDYYSNGDDDPIAFNTDENALYNEARRGPGGAISNVLVENLQFDAVTNGLRFFGNSGIGTLNNITIRNTHGTVIQGNQSCAGPTVAGTTYLGRDGSDQALASMSNISIDSWEHAAIAPATTALTLKSVQKLRLANIPQATALTLTGCEDYTGDRAPGWQRFPAEQQ